MSFSLRGEAVVVALPNGRYLFALLKDTPSAGWLFYPKMPAKEAGELLERADASNSRQLELPRKHYPLLVTFGDIKDPASVKKVDPADLGASFGPGYRLNSITVSVTDEPVTEGKVEAVLGWLSDDPEPKLSPASGRTTNIPFSRRVSHGDFIRR
ncbi:hypothetical protein P6U16_04945 [Rhizobium sp. 32-5/1]|uniref:hypothetical protein n=1 Tax=Rhizobium sp. 32-5/1 TaxID=3019602 RepID=UPI00240DAAE3|nr:hypothetical protein [Rhizobium sp. 32-5/1]WEZ84065.1 hypothetical protein P6U16_04945 [Rhizobium sp. 32-5/1]